MTTGSEPLIEATDVTKVFCRHLRRSMLYGASDIARELVLRRPAFADRGLRKAEFRALDNVSFELHRGNSLAIVGDNGAGKSTLLKILYGLIKPDAGTVRIRGRLGALIELGTGFDPLLTGRENIAINGAILGLTDRRLRELTEEIVDFAEIEDAIDSPLRFYSSGMVARLAFAVAAHLEPDILLVDEVLAVGDLAFQRKCATHILRYVERGGSLVFISHNPHQVLTLCQQGMVLEDGRLTFDGSAVEAMSHYHTNRRDDLVGASGRHAAVDTHWPVVIERLQLTDPDGGPARSGGPAVLQLAYRSQDAHDMIWGFTIHTADGWVCVTGDYDMTPQRLEAGSGVLECRIRELPLLAGQYTVRAGIATPDTLHPLGLFGHEDAPLALRVLDKPGIRETGMAQSGQLVRLGVEWSR